MTHWLDVLCALVWQFGGSVIASPSELAADGRQACPEWLRCGWPASGHILVKLLTTHAEELLSIGLLVHWTPPGPGQPEWLAITDLDAPPKPLPRLASECYVAVPRPLGGIRAGGWPTPWKGRATA